MLNQKLELLKRAVEHSTDGLLLIAVESDEILFANPATTRIYGSDPVSSFADANARFAFVDEADRQRLINKYWNLQENGQEYLDEYRLSRSDGTSCQVLEHSQLITESQSGYRVIVVNVHIMEMLSARQPSGALEELADTTSQVTVAGKAEKALQDSEVKYRTIFENSGNPMMFIEEDTTISLANKEFEKLSGYSKEEIEGKKSWTEFIATADDLQRMKDYHRLRRVDPEAPPRSCEFQFVGREGQLRDLAITVAVFPGTTKSLAALVDITDRNRVELQSGKLSCLRERLLGTDDLSKKLKLITDAVVEIFDADFARIWIVDEGDLCEAGCQHASVAEDSHVCRDRTRCLHLAVSSGRYTHTDGAHQRVPLGAYKIGRVASGEESSFITNDVANDPRVHDHEWTKSLGLVSFAGFRLLSPEKGPIGVLALFRKTAIVPDEERALEELADTTSQVIVAGKAEKALQDSETKYRTIFENSGNPMMFIEEDTTISLVNKEFEKLSGYSKEEIEGKKSWTDFIATADDLQRMKDYHRLRRVDPEAPPRSYEFQFVGREGQLRDLAITVAVFPGTTKSLAALIDITDRKRAEDELQKLASVVKYSSDLINIASLDGQMVFLNEAGCEMLGVDPEEVCGKNILQVIPDHLQEKMQSELLPKLLDGGNWEGELEYLNQKTRRLAVVHAMTFVIRDSRTGRPLCFANVSHDITDRKHAEEALRESEKRYRRLVESVTDYIYSVKFVDGRPVSTSHGEGCVAVTGYTSREYDENPYLWYQMVAEEDRPAVEGQAAMASNGMVATPLEHRIIHKDGSIRWVRNTPAIHQDEHGGVVSYDGLISDITERKLIEEELRESEEKFRVLYDTMAQGVVYHDISGRIISANPAAEHVLGLTRDQMMGRTSSDPRWRAVHEDGTDFSGEEHPAMVALRNGVPVRHVVMGIVRPGDERIRWLLIDATPQYRDYETSPYQVYSTFSDITELMRAEQELRESEQSFRHVVESSPVGMHFYRLEPDGNLVFTGANPAADAILKFDHGQIVGKTIEAAFPDLLGTEVPDCYRRVAGSGEAWQSDQIDYKDGRISGAFAVNAFQTSPGKMAATFQDITMRKRTEEALRESEERFRSLIENSTDIITICNRDGSRRYVSPTVKQALGYDPDEMVGRSVTEGIHPDDVPGMMRKYESLLEVDGREISCTIRHIHKDGSWHIVECKAKNLLNDTAVAGIVINTRDVTERKRDEERIRFQALVLSEVRDAIVATDTQMCIEYWNSGAERLYGVAAEHVYGTPLIELHETYSPNREILTAILDSVTADRVWSGEITQRHVSGKTIHSELSVSMLHDSSGAATGYLAVAHDITERKRAEQELARLATAVEQAAEAIVITDTDGNIEYVNPAFERITGYSGEDAIGKNAELLNSGEQDSEFYERLWETLKSGKSWIGRFRNKKKDGSLYHEESAISPIRDRAGNIINYVAVKRDISQETEFESRLRQSQKLEAVGLLASGIAHDFNNLLAGIRGFAELLTLDAQTGSKALNYAEEIVSAASRAADLTGQLLAFARQGNYLSIPVDLHHTVDETIAILAHTIDKRIQITKDYRAAKVTIKGDPSQIQSAILNLGVNARDAMPDGGIMTFATENVHLSEEYCRLHSLDAAAGEYLTVSITDSGTGIDKSLVSHVFDPFFTTKEQGKGTGLGLASVYGCVRNHHGTVEVTTEWGKGSTFKLIFPLQKLEVDIEPAATTAPNLSGHEHILIVDDEGMVRDLAESMLTKAGYRVTKCGDAAEAVELCRDSAVTIDLVLLDMIMPKMHGKDTLAAIRQHNPDIKAVLMSGYTGEDLEGIANLTQTGFLAKPFQMKTLLQSVRQMFDTQKLTSETRTSR